jgi:hypothetical protein
MIGGGGSGDAFRFRRRVSQLRRFKLLRNCKSEVSRKKKRVTTKKVQNSPEKNAGV